MIVKDDEYFMKKAIACAKKAKMINEVPIGCVIVQNNKIIATGYNKRETKKNALNHAEIVAINKACKKLGGWRLINCKIYITLEPCPMCAGAIINSRIDEVVFGAYDKKAGSIESVAQLFKLPYNHIPKYKGGVMANECAELLTRFFKSKRNK